MGKFRLSKVKKRVKGKEKSERRRLREVLKRKELIKFIPPDTDYPSDGILLFGSHKGEKISELLAEFKTSPYVLNYLAQSKDLPSKIRKKVKIVIDNYDPFDSSPSPYSGLNVREVSEEFPDPGDEIPW